MKKYTDLSTGKIWQATLTGDSVKIETGLPGKLKVSEKKFTSEEEAKKFLKKQEWATLKKGFVMNNAEATPGEALMHYYVCNAYTGMLPIAEISGDLISTRHESGQDEIIIVDKTGNLKSATPLPGKNRLVIDMKINSAGNLVLLNIDHEIFEWVPEIKNFTLVSSKRQKPSSMLSVVESRSIWFIYPDIIIKDTENNSILYQNIFEPELFSGHTSLCSGAISMNGEILALCIKSGEVRIIEVDSGKLLGTIKGSFSFISQMEFDASGKTLIIREENKNWGIRFLNVEKFQEMDPPPLDVPSPSVVISHFCLNRSRTKMAMLNRNKVTIFDLIEFKEILSFKVEHLVKSAKLAFIENNLSIRTDYGCLSLYRM